MDTLVTWEDFQRFNIRVGTISSVKEFPEARKSAYVLQIDFGPEIGLRKSSAQITGNYNLSDLPGKQVICVLNFSPKQIGPMKSECLVTGFTDHKGEIVLATVDKVLPNGARLH